MKLLVALLLALTAGSASALSYSFEELRKGLPEAAAIDAARSEGLIVSADPRGGGHLLADAKSNEVVSILWVCSGRLYGYSLAAKGGASAFVKRVAQFNVEFGAPGSATATSKMQSFGEDNTIEITWQKDWRTAIITYTPSVPGLGESQWVRYSASQVCGAK
jgi:hypothetical protein